MSAGKNNLEKVKIDKVSALSNELKNIIITFQEEENIDLSANIISLCLDVRGGREGFSANYLYGEPIMIAELLLSILMEQPDVKEAFERLLSAKLFRNLKDNINLKKNLPDDIDFS